MDNDQVKALCEKFVQSLPTAGFVLVGYKKEDGSYDFVQSMKDMDLKAYTKGVLSMLQQVSEKL